MSELPLTRRAVFMRTMPIMGANVAAPLMGLVDLAVIGNTGQTGAIAAVALGTLVFNMLYWSLGFLRMGATALAAQADGAGQPGAVRAVLYRALILAGGFGLIFIAAQWPLREAALALFSAGPDVAADTRAYTDARIWGAPAALAGFAVYGWLSGLGLTGRALVLQIALNLANAALSVWFVFGLDWGVAGVAGASALAQWLHLALAAVVIAGVLRARGRAAPERIFDRAGLVRLFAVNRDLFVRTLALLAGFYWFNEASLREGADVLAGNAILLQYIAISAFVLDAFAHVAEAETGRAAGARDWARLKRAFRLTSELALGGALLLTLAFLVFGEAFILAMTSDPAARETALSALVFCALVPLIGAPSW
ncbi:MAG: MATE family efflux transporter [Oceanicaulis sp.]|nr:MATE family efflux transporter [Oceanicaulis sp.]